MLWYDFGVTLFAHSQRTKSYDVKRSESKVEKSVENDIQCPLVIAVGDIYGLWNLAHQIQIICCGMILG